MEWASWGSLGRPEEGKGVPSWRKLDLVVATIQSLPAGFSASVAPLKELIEEGLHVSCCHGSRPAFLVVPDQVVQSVVSSFGSSLCDMLRVDEPDSWKLFPERCEKSPFKVSP